MYSAVLSMLKCLGTESLPLLGSGVPTMDDDDRLTLDDLLNEYDPELNEGIDAIEEDTSPPVKQFTRERGAGVIAQVVLTLFVVTILTHLWAALYGDTSRVALVWQATEQVYSWLTIIIVAIVGYYFGQTNSRGTDMT